MKLADIDSRAAILSAIEEFDRLGRVAFLKLYGFGISQSYFIEHQGKRYDSKAIVGVARKYTGRGLTPLTPADFSGGQSTVQKKLESLGFTVVRESVNADWSDEELIIIITDYLEMLKAELAGTIFNKTDHRNELIPKLKNRTKGSIEFKHSNISSALAELGLPYVNGYKPRAHSQAAIADILDELLNQDKALRKLLETMAATTAAPQHLQLVDPPEAGLGVRKRGLTRRAVRIDFQRREEQNRQMGLRGEELVVRHEQERLKALGRDDLATRVEHVAQTQGDGLGYDILSFDGETGAENYIEVKTTTGGIDAPFLVSLNEVEFSDEESERFMLFRIFDFGGKPKFYIRKGPLRLHFGLTEKLFLATP
jgi:hypothetical protein